MSWTKALVAGVVAGVVLWLADFVMHGVIMAQTYVKYPVFTQEQANPFWFLVISICITIPAALIFAKTRECWSAGVAGGATFGFFLGLFSFFPHFYSPLIYEGFPYYLGWCWGGISLIGMVIVGVVLAAVYKSP